LRLKYVVLVGLAVLSVMGISDVYAQSPIVVTTDKSSYSEGDTILVTGEVSQLLGGFNLSLIMQAPNGNIVAIDQLTVEADKKFSSSLAAGGSLMKVEGTYTITVQYGDNKSRMAQTSFEFEGSTTTPISEMTVTVTDGITIPGLGKTIQINIIGAVGTVEIKIIAEDGKIIETLSYLASDHGEINQPWIIPKETEPGVYTVRVEDAFNSAETTFVIDDDLETPPHDPIVGGTFIPINTTSLLLAQVQSISMWMIPVLAGGVGIGVFMIKRRK